MDVDIQETSVQNAGLDLAVDLVLFDRSEKSKHNGIKEEGSRVTPSATAASNQRCAESTFKAAMDFKKDLIKMVS